MIYECPKCTKKFDRKSNYTTHINKKYPCTPILEGPAQKPHKTAQITTKTAQNRTSPAQIHSNSSDFTQNKLNKLNKPNNANNTDKSKFQCKHCSKILSRADILHRHITKYWTRD
jgi:uncharacterized C2H2 Zn-finger protein